jgi:hypothetical protein
MNDIHTMIDAYRQADPENRLNLYLAHPGLRKAFIRIDMAEYRQAVRARTIHGSAPGRFLGSRLLASLAGCCFNFRKT